MYESPICVTLGDIQHQMEKQTEGEILRVVWKCGVNVNKEELLKALQYDRNQYEKGYRDAKAEQQWVSCNERLPEEEVDVLVAVSHDTVMIAWIYDGQWTNDGVSLLANVKAWMSLPKPYKEDE